MDRLQISFGTTTQERDYESVILINLDLANHRAQFLHSPLQLGLHFIQCPDSRPVSSGSLLESGSVSTLAPAGVVGDNLLEDRDGSVNPALDIVRIS